MGQRTIWRRRTSSLAAAFVTVGLGLGTAGVLGVVAQLPLTVATATAAGAAPPPTTCEPNTIFNVAGSQTNPAPTGSAAGDVYSLNVTTGVNTQIGAFNSGSTPVNGLGVTPSLSDYYAVAQNPTTTAVGQTIYQFSQSGVASSFFGPNTGLTLVMGAIDPANGIYYYAGYTGSGATLTLAIYGFNPATDTDTGRVANVSEAGTGFSTGDIAFDSSGNLFILAGSNLTGATQTNTAAVQRVDGPLPTSGPPAAPFNPANPTTLATRSTPAAQGFYNGIAFAADGTIYAQYATSGTSASAPGSAFLDDINPNTGEPITGRVTQSGVPDIGILTDLAGCALPGTLTVQKDLPDGRAGTGDQFTMSIAGDGITEGNTITTSGTASGVQDERVGPLPGVPATTYTIAESMAQGNTTSIDAYASSWECHDTNSGGTFSLSGTGTSFDLIFPTPDNTVLGANILCTFTNTPEAPSLTLTKELGGTGRVTPPGTDQFTVQILNSAGAVVGTTANATTTGTGDTVDAGTGTTTLPSATAGPYSLTEVGVGSTTLTDYKQIMECTDENGVVPEADLPNGLFSFSQLPTVTPVPGSDIQCVLTNTPSEPVLQLDKELGSDRVLDSDQFTVAIRQGSATGTPLPPEGTADPTTSGTGSIVDPETGTTGFVPVTVTSPGTPYFLTETAAGTPPTNLALYTSTVTCVDEAGIQSGLPVDVPLSDNPSVTPDNLASIISCTITNTAIPPTLQLSKALPDGRANAGDQFTMQILAGDETTVEADATTTGTSTTVADGTATLSPATAGDAYFLNEIPAAGTPTNLAQYAATVTCTDTNGVVPDADLPDDVPFGGPFAIMPPLGAAITCTITNIPIAPSLELDKALGSARIADTDQFTMQIENASGTVVGTITDATTTGTGDVVDPGTGTTGLSPAAFGTSYTLAEAPAGTTNLAAYAATITCTDSEGLQPGLPVDAAFSASTIITPVAGASISCTVTNAVKPAISLSVAKTSSPSPYTPGQSLSYTIVVKNGGPDTASSVTVDDPLPSQLQSAGFTWTCRATTGSACGAQSGASPLHDTPTIVAGGSVTYVLTGTVPAATTGQLVNTVTVTPPPGTFDPGCDPSCTATNVIPPPPAPPAAAPPSIPLASAGTATDQAPALTGAYILLLVRTAAGLLCAGIVLLLFTRAGARRRARPGRAR